MKHIRNRILLIAACTGSFFRLGLDEIRNTLSERTPYRDGSDTLFVLVGHDGECRCLYPDDSEALQHSERNGRSKERLRRLQIIRESVKTDSRLSFFFASSLHLFEHRFHSSPFPPDFRLLLLFSFSDLSSFSLVIWCCVNNYLFMKEKKHF